VKDVEINDKLPEISIKLLENTEPFSCGEVYSIAWKKYPVHVIIPEQVHVFVDPLNREIMQPYMRFDMLMLFTVDKEEPFAGRKIAHITTSVTDHLPVKLRVSYDSLKKMYEDGLIKLAEPNEKTKFLLKL
jgi:hypothetical protein